MTTNDEDLKRDLADATGRDLPDEDEFAARVLDGIEGGGGERTLAVGLPRPSRLWPAAAAALVAGVLIGALFFGGGAGNALVGPAAPGELDLPAAETGEALPGPIKIRVVAGLNPDYEALRERLIAATRPAAAAPARITSRLDDSPIDPLREEVKPDIEETKPVPADEKVIEDPVIKDAQVRDGNAPDEINDEPFSGGGRGGPVGEPGKPGEFRFFDTPFSGRPAFSTTSGREVLLLADRAVPWRTIQWVLQTCADPEIGLTRIHWAVAGDRAIPVFLPADRGLGAVRGPIQGRMSVRLRRSAGENASAIEYGGRDLGEGPEGFENLRIALEFAPPSSLEIDASANVPFGEVAHAVDLSRKAGCSTFTLVAAPPRKK